MTGHDDPIAARPVAARPRPAGPAFPAPSGSRPTELAPPPPLTPLPPDATVAQAGERLRADAATPVDDGTPRAENLFGVASSLPRPGWVVLDAAREDRFTGEIRFETAPPVTVHVDRGRIYLAERVTDPPLGERLVAMGALAADDLRRGAIVIGERQHLGRLFERVPDLEPASVVLTMELMTEECTSWLANQLVTVAVAVPYRHHPSGVHRWEPSDAERAEPPQLASASDGRAAVGPTVTGVSSVVVDADVAAVADVAAIADVAFDDDGFDDAMTWDTESWHDPHRRVDELEIAAVAEIEGVARPSSGEPSAQGPADYRLDRPGDPPVPDADPFADGPPAEVGTPIDPVDDFEIIWPSGEVGEQLGRTAPPEESDVDRTGASARMAPSRRRTDTPPTDGQDAHVGAPTQRMLLSEVEGDHVTGVDPDDELGDDVLVARAPDGGVAPPSVAGVPAPEEIAAKFAHRAEPGAAMMLQQASSVFDLGAAPSPVTVDVSTSTTPAPALPGPGRAEIDLPIDVAAVLNDRTDDDDAPERAGALRRLIDFLGR